MHRPFELGFDIGMAVYSNDVYQLPGENSCAYVHWHPRMRILVEGLRTEMPFRDFVLL